MKGLCKVNVGLNLRQKTKHKTKNTFAHLNERGRRSNRCVGTIFLGGLDHADHLHKEKRPPQNCAKQKKKRQDEKTRTITLFIRDVLLQVGELETAPRKQCTLLASIKSNRTRIRASHQTGIENRAPQVVAQSMSSSETLLATSAKKSIYIIPRRHSRV